MILTPQGISDALSGPRRLRSPLMHRRQPNVGASLLGALVDWWSVCEQIGDSVSVNNSWAVPTGGNPASAIGPDRTLARSFAVGGASIYLVTPSSTRWALGDTDYTMVAWMRQDTATNPIGFAAMVDGDVFPFYALQLGINANFYTSNNGTTSYYAPVAVSAVVGTWYHLVGRHNSVANTLSISVNNGALAASVAHTVGSRPIGTAGRVYIGGRPNATNRPCSVQRAGIWNRVLTAAEEAWLYNNGRGRDYPFL